MKCALNFGNTKTGNAKNTEYSKIMKGNAGMSSLFLKDHISTGTKQTKRVQEAIKRCILVISFSNRFKQIRVNRKKTSKLTKRRRELLLGKNPSTSLFPMFSKGLVN